MQQNRSFNLSAKGLEGGVTMRRAIWLTTGEIVLVKRYDLSNNIAIIECNDGRLDTVEASAIHFLVYPGYLKAAS
jgi:hypothetical protein